MEERKLNFLEEIIEKDLAEGKVDSIMTRFPPEPNGYLHLGHAKSICLNFGLAQKYGGKTNLRYDDTNPTKEDTEYVDAIKEDIAWLGFHWDKELYASDYFDQLYEWAEKIINHYKEYGVDPRTKQLLFSDSLNFDRAQELYDHFKDKAKVSFGIGTFCSNDTNVRPLNIVIKLQYVNGRPVAKLSDCDGKSMCMDEDYLAYLKNSVRFRLERVKHLKELGLK